MKKAQLALLLTPAVLALATTVLSYGRGAIPGTRGTSGQVPLNAARQAPSCATTGCHSSQGQNNLTVFVDLPKRSLSKNEAISVAVRSTGGIPGQNQNPPNWGGFIAEVTRGKFTAGTTSAIDSTGRFITHTFAFNAGRNWKFGYTAPAAAGLVELYPVVNTVDGNGRPTGDSFGFYGSSSAAARNTPIRLYVNETGVRQIGAGCIGGFRNPPVIGSKTVPSVGNAGFAIELAGARPASPAALLIGGPGRLDLGLIGMTGCTLHLNPAGSLSLATFTSAGSAQFGEGKATFGMPIPNDPSLRGQKLIVQTAILDAAAPRSLRATMSPALELTFQ